MGKAALDRSSLPVRSAFDHIMNNLVWADIYVRVQHIYAAPAQSRARRPKDRKSSFFIFASLKELSITS